MFLLRPPSSRKNRFLFPSLSTVLTVTVLKKYSALMRNNQGKKRLKVNPASLHGLSVRKNYL